MSETSMSIKTFKQVAIKLPPNVSILLRANHGVGKSKVIRQVSALIRNILLEKKIVDMSKYRDIKNFYPVIDRRLSQMSEGDMVGLPSTDGEVTRFNPPDWYKKACLEPCALFLDELNRATPEVMQAAFQIVLDRELNGWKLHPETRVYSAINNSALYTVNEMDPALLDRFFTIDLCPDYKEFCDWARSDDPDQGGNLNSLVPEFIETSKRHDGTNWLYQPKKSDPGGVHPSPRSWEMLNNAITYAGIYDSPESDLFYHMCIGFVGVEASIAFCDFCKSAESRIKGEEIVNDYHKKNVREKIKRLGQSRMNDVIEKVTEYVLGNNISISERQGKNINQLMLDMPDELKISLWTRLTSKGIDNVELAKSIHKYCAENILSVFGVKMGEAGIGMIPNIPGLFGSQEKQSKA